METASLAQIRKELKTLDNNELQDLCGRLGRFRKENKEFLSYLLFDSYNEDGFIEKIKWDVEDAFSNINTTGYYLAKKTIRKALRIIDRSIRFSGKAETEVELRLHFCEQMRSCGLRIKGSRVIFNLYSRQIAKIEKALDKMHPDLQFDFMDDLTKAKGGSGD